MISFNDRDQALQQNGSILLKQQYISKEALLLSQQIILFTDEEPKKVTNNYASDRILGWCGCSLVFKGMLTDQRAVSVKRSKVIGKSQTERLVNESDSYAG